MLGLVSNGRVGGLPGNILPALVATARCLQKNPDASMSDLPEQWLAVDAGNSRIKYGVVQNGRLGQCDSVSKNAWSVFAARMRQYADLPVWVAHVGSMAEKKQMRQLFAQQPQRWIRTMETSGGISNGYRTPTQLGVDRWLALVAARQITRQAAVVVSAGTALTIDALSANGMFTGGAILPGLSLMINSLATHTPLPGGQRGAAGALSTLPLVVSPQTTADGIATGVRLAAAGAVREFQKQFMPRARVIIITGGQAEQLLTFFPNAKHQPDLVLRGMVSCWHEEKELADDFA